MNDVTSYFAFAEVVRTGSFTAAAQALATTKATVSKQVKRLETTMGVRLLNRTTRKLSVTAEGEVLYQRCRRMTEELEAAKAELMRSRAKPRGYLRVSVPLTFGLMHVAPAIPEFLERYPEVEVDLQFDDRVVNLVEHGFDVAIRISQLNDSTLVARKLAVARRVVCATPEYFKRHGTPRTPEDLKGHRCLQYTYTPSGTNWRLRGPEGEVSVRVQAVFHANNSLALKEAVLAHAGVSQFPTFVVAQELRAGQLVTVLDDYALPELTVWGVHTSGRTVTPKVRAWIDHLARRFARDRTWNVAATAQP